MFSNISFIDFNISFSDFQFSLGNKSAQVCRNSLKSASPRSSLSMAHHEHWRAVTAVGDRQRPKSRTGCREWGWGVSAMTERRDWAP